MLKERWFKTYSLQKYDPSIHPSIPYPNPLLKRFYLGSINVVFGIVTALNMGAMLWNVSLLYTKDYLYSSLLLCILICFLHLDKYMLLCMY